MSRGEAASGIESLLRPTEEGRPVFDEPWQAQAFAMVRALIERGLFSSRDWADALAAEIAVAQAAGDPDRGDTYYRHWLAALERLVAVKGLVGGAELVRRRSEWADAAAHTPFGRPIELER